MRVVVSGFERGESPRINESIVVYLRYVYDYSIQVIDTVETFRDMASGMLDTYRSSVSNSMNEVMKAGKIIATIFIPVTFVAGLYGMNFKYILELDWHWGYFAGLFVMVGIAALMVPYFKRKKWL